MLTQVVTLDSNVCFLFPDRPCAECGGAAAPPLQDAPALPWVCVSEGGMATSLPRTLALPLST